MHPDKNSAPGADEAFKSKSTASFLFFLFFLLHGSADVFLFISSRWFQRDHIRVLRGTNQIIFLLFLGITENAQQKKDHQKKCSQFSRLFSIWPIMSCHYSHVSPLLFLD